MQVVEGEADIESVDAFVDEIREIGAAHDATVQAFDARYIVDREHLRQAVELADRERGRGEGIARDAGVEILLYAAGRRQINRALEIGVSGGHCPVVAVAVGDDATAAADALSELLEPADTLGAFDDQRVRDLFEISERERATTAGTLADIVHERVTLLVVER
jgi:KEOPS complex subunit Cgi121